MVRKMVEEMKTFDPEETQREYKENSPSFYDFRDVLVHQMLYAFRKSPGLRNRVRSIAEGYGDTDMIEDLGLLAELGKSNPEPLSAINSDMKLLDEAEAKWLKHAAKRSPTPAKGPQRAVNRTG